MLAAIEETNSKPRRIVKRADDETWFKLMNVTDSSF
jgi:hypothetical protein